MFETYANALQYPAEAGGGVFAIGGQFVATNLFDKPVLTGQEILKTRDNRVDRWNIK